MKNVNDLWEAIGELDDDEAGQVLARLFSMYEECAQRGKDADHAAFFFRNLDTALDIVGRCNLNRR